MFLLTERFLISEVAKRWLKQYPELRWLKQYSELPDWKRGVYEKLCKIDLNTASAIEVNQIIGNDTWTTQRCNVCRNNILPAVVVGEDEPTTVCHKCVKQMSDLLK